MKKIKEIVIISGKGGTGKTTVTASLAAILPDKIVVDADVDAANLHLLMELRHTEVTDFIGKPVAHIDPDKCTTCDLCRELCRFQAVRTGEDYYTVDPFACDGCGLCRIACPVGAVEMKAQTAGQWFNSQTDFGRFVHARLIPGAESSGELVTVVKQQAKQAAVENNIDTVLIDAPPGIGCPVIAAISGAFLAIIVTEPTYSAAGDMERVIELTTHFGVKSSIVINRCDINPANTRRIENFAREKGIPVIAVIPHSECIMEEIAMSRPPVHACEELAGPVEKIVEYIKRVSA